MMHSEERGKEMKVLKKALAITLSVLISFSMLGNTVWAMAAEGEQEVTQETVTHQHLDSEETVSDAEEGTEEGETEETDPDESEGEEDTCPDGKHTWGAHELSQEPTYEEAGIITHTCEVCGTEEDVDEEDWTENDLDMAQRKKNLQGEITTLGEKKPLTLETSDDEEYGQYFSFTPDETGTYEIHLDNEDLSGNFAKNDAELTDMEDGEELQANVKYYICVLGSGSGNLWITKVGQKTDISADNKYKIEFEEKGPFTVVFDEDGKPTEIEPEINVVSTDSESEETVTFDVEYKNNTMPGTATVIATGTGSYEGSLRANFTIEKISQDLDLSDLSMTVGGENVTLDLSSLVGNVTVEPSTEEIVTITQDSEKTGKYTVKALKQGTVEIKITAAGNEYYNEYNTTIKAAVSKADHHHTYMKKDANGTYVYDETKGTHYDATCLKPEHMVYVCTDEECEEYNKKIEVTISPELADHDWGAHQRSEDEDKAPTYEDAGTLVHVCKVCGTEEDVDEEDWEQDDYKLVQRLKNDVKDNEGNPVKLSVGTSQNVSLESYNDDEYGKFLTFIPTEDEAYQINIDEVEGADFEAVFVQDDVDLTEMSSAETLQAGKTYYICVRGNGECKVSVSKVVKQIDIKEEGYQVKFEDDLDTKVFEADGNAIEPAVSEVTPKYEDEEVTYNVTYEDNKAPGTAKVIITGSGNYKGTIEKTFTIVKGKQKLDLPAVTLVKGNETTIDLTSLIGEITITPSESGIVDVQKKEQSSGDDRKIYTIKANEAGETVLAITAAGNVYYGEYTGKVKVTVSKPEHHHTYLNQDKDGKYTVYKPVNGTSIKSYPATCLKPAYTVYKCEDTDCGAEETKIDEKGTLGAHSYKEENVEATCTTEGYIRQTCTVCGYSQIKAESYVPKLDHTYIYKETVDATSDSRAYNLYECSVCKLQQREYFGCVGGATATGKHTFKSQVVKATCTKGGYTKNTCTVCGYSEIVDETDELGHDMKDTEYLPTEDKYGYTHSECSRCGYFVDTITHCKIRFDQAGNRIDAHEGDPVQGSESQPDCEKPGTMQYKCRLCKKIYEVEIPDQLPAKAHNWVTEEGDEATCEEEGEETCSVCKMTRVISKLGHKWVVDEANTKAATYDDKGVTAYKCSNPGCDETKETYTPRLRDEGGSVRAGSNYIRIGEGTNTHGKYYKFIPSATKNYYVSGNDVFDTVFCQADDDLTEMTDAALLTAGKLYYICVEGDGEGYVTIENITNFTNIQKEGYTLKVLDAPESIVYTGDPVELDNLRIKGQNNDFIDIPENWTIRYENNINAGKAKVSVTGQGKYNGTISTTFTINKASQEVEEKYFDLQVDENKELDKWEFFGDKVSVEVTDGKDVVQVLRIEKGYKLAGKKVGKAAVRIVADGDANHKPIDVTIPVTVTVKDHIHAFGATDATGKPTGDVDSAKIVAMIGQAPADLKVGESFTAKDASTNKSAKLTLLSKNCEDGNQYEITCGEEGCNGYTITYLDDRTEVIKDHVYKTYTTADGDVENEGTVIIKPTYETLGKKELTCTVCGAKTYEDIECLERINLSDFEVELSSNYFMYDGREKKPSVRLLDDNERALSSSVYTVTYQNNRNPGDNTARVIIRPRSNDYCGSVTATYSIVQVSLSRSSFTVSGSAKLILRGIATIDDYETNRDGIISWNRKTGVITGKKAGQVRLTIYAYDKEDNDITISVTVTVMPKATSIAKIKKLKKGQISVSWKKNKTCGGYQIQYSLDKKFKKKVKTVKVQKKTATSAVIKGLKAKKTYYVRIRAVDSKAAKAVSAWSKAKKVKIK